MDLHPSPNRPPPGNPTAPLQPEKAPSPSTSLDTEEESEDLYIEEPSLQAGIEPEGSVRTTSRPHPLRGPSKTPSKAQRTHDRLLRLSTWSLLVFATIWGVLARLGLEWIGGFAGGEVFVTIWPQAVGCLIMGCVVERKKGLERIYPPLFVALGTGFCGSTTTFSSWMSEVFLLFARLDPTFSTSRFSGFLSGFANTIITLGVSTTSLRLGVHLSSSLPRRPPSSSRTPHHSPSHSHPSYTYFSLLLGPLFYLSSLFLLIFGPPSWRHKTTFAILLGPPGTLIRYELSRALNPRIPSFPLGTLTANSLAVLIYALSSLLQRRVGTGVLGCAALQGVQDGFCGALSTVSTLVVELRGLGMRESWRYFGSSWGVGQGFFVVLLGGWVWGGGGTEKCGF